MKFEDLTQHEVQALKHEYNFADAHTHQSQSVSQLEIVRKFPELWLESAKTKQETLNNLFVETFYQIRGEEVELYDTYQILKESGITYMAIEDTGKTWPIQDAKVAMLKVSDNIYDEMYSIYTAYILNVSPFILKFLTEYIRDSHNCQFGSTRNLLNTNRKILEEICQNTILKVQKPKGKVSVAWCEITEPNLTATELQKILYEGGVYVLPGTYFYWCNPLQGERYIRIALARDTDNFFAGMSLMRQIIEQLNVKSSMPLLAKN